MSQTRSRRKKKTPPEDHVEEIQSDTEVEQIPHPKKSTTLDKFKMDMEQLKGENRLLKEEIRLLKEENRLLKEQTDFYKDKACLSEAGPKPAKGSLKRRPEVSSVSSDSDSSSYNRNRKDKKRRRKRSSSSDSSSDSKPKKQASFGERVLTPEDVAHRYKKVLKVYQKNRSVSTTCQVLKVDRNTIALTAVIADVLIAAEAGDFGEIPHIKQKQSLASFAKQCKECLDANEQLQAKVEQMRGAMQLLPIKYKLLK